MARRRKRTTKRRSPRRSKMDIKGALITAAVGAGTVVAAKYLSKMDFFKSLGGGKFTFLLAGGLTAGAAWKFVKDHRIRNAMMAASGVPIALGIAQAMDSDAMIDALQLNAEDDYSFLPAYPMSQNNSGQYVLADSNSDPLGDFNSDPLGEYALQ